MMDAIIIAGGVPAKEDLLYEFTQGKPKALLDIAGKPMLQWVLDAVDAASSVERVVVVGLEDLQACHSGKMAVSLPTQGSILENIRAGVAKVSEFNPQVDHVLVISSDIPAITPQAIEWVVGEAEKHDEDVYYNVVTRQVMEARYPNSNRSYARLQDLEVCGGDMNVVRASMVTENEALWQKIIDSRKSVFRQAALIGYGTLLLLLLRRITLEGAVRRVTKRLHITGRALVCPYAEVGMDVDKPHQLAIIRQDLQSRLKE